MTEKKMKLEDWLDDLCVRFIVNLPTEELESVERICFQVEEAQWFYEDFIRPLDPELESLNLKNFSLKIFKHCPMFSDFSSDDHLQAFAEFLAYKTRVPVRGAIMLNEKMDEVVLVKGWKKGANWSFPRGKINKDESDLDCAIREVYEETGYDIKAAGLIGDDKEVEAFEMDLREQNMMLFVFRGVPMDTRFEPRTRKEISKIDWWKLSELPTLKKKKHQQEGQGGDLAMNANKFYKVAPFLPRLKKYISVQKKLNKARQSSLSAAVSAPVTEEPIVVDDQETTKEQASDDEMARLLNSLRQSAEPINLPEATAPEAGAKDIAAQLKDFLGVRSAPTASRETVLESAAPEPVSNPKANSLLALLQSKPELSAQLPQTPMEQVIEQPMPPPSPRHPPHQHQSLSPMPPPAFPTQDQTASTRAGQSEPLQTRSIPPPSQPAQLIPRVLNNQHRKPPLKANNHTLAPYQRTGDPQFSQYAQLPGNQVSAIPRANKLPPPKLNAQSSALLDLFKAGAIAKAPKPSLNADALAEVIKPTTSADEILHVTQHSTAHHESEDIVQAPSRGEQASQLTNISVPPQATPSAPAPSTKGKEAGKPDVEQQHRLLKLFRTPPATMVQPSKPENPMLQPAPVPVELSALPTTPSHSREPSKTDGPSSARAAVPVRNGSVRLEKRPRKSTAKLQKPSVSATVSGPLNVPQFDILAKNAKGAQQTDSKMEYTKSPKRSPIKILARPNISQEPPLVPSPKRVTEHTAGAKQEEAVVPRLETFVTPTKKQPPTPNLKAQEVPTKPFHPQILRRPAHLDESNEPSPIQPLPSPKLNTFPDRGSTQPTDHKKSLLSLFTKPSPSVSPVSAALTSAIDPSALISPLTGPSPQEQADAALKRLTQSVGGLSHDPKPTPGPSQPPIVRMGSVGNAIAEGIHSGGSSGKQTPISKTTPADKSFLLGYLNKVLESGK